MSKPSYIDHRTFSLLNDLRDAVRQNAVDKGFVGQLEKDMTDEQKNGDLGALVQAAIYVANLHGEMSEFWEAFRAGKIHAPTALGLPALTCAEEEIADVLIRALDTAAAFGVDVSKAVEVKMAYNRSRPALHGGKKA